MIVMATVRHLVSGVARARRGSEEVLLRSVSMVRVVRTSSWRASAEAHDTDVDLDAGQAQQAAGGALALAP